MQIPNRVTRNLQENISGIGLHFFFFQVLISVSLDLTTLFTPFCDGQWVRKTERNNNAQKTSLYAVKVRRHTPWSRVRCHGCRFMHSPFHSPLHSRWHSLRISLKYTTLVHMRSSYTWTMKSWQRSEWRLGFNSVFNVQIGMYVLCYWWQRSCTMCSNRIKCRKGVQ